MKTKFRFLSLAMVLVLSMGLLAACGSDDTATTGSSSTQTDSTQTDSTQTDSTQTDSTQTDSTQTESTQTDSAQTSITSEENSETNAEAEDVIGEISYISSSYMSLKVYEPAAEVSDYTSLDVSTLTATDSTESVTLDTDAEYYYISDSAMVAQTADDLAAGDLVAVTTTEAGVQQIILLERESADNTGESDTDQVNEDVVAEVTAIDGNVLTLTIYEAAETATAISDYTQVNLEDYIATETEETYTIDSTVSVSVIEDGVMAITDSSEIVVGDMLVIYTTESGTPSIAVYHAE